MAKYETLTVLSPDLPEAQIRETIDRVRRLIEQGGGIVQGIQEWGIRELAYPIRKRTHGYYVLAEYNASADVVFELERTLKIAEEVLRFISVIAAPMSASRRVTSRAPSLPSEGEGSTENFSQGNRSVLDGR